MRHAMERVYRNYEEFEREELRRFDMLDASLDDLLDEMFMEELDIDLDGEARETDADADEE